MTFYDYMMSKHKGQDSPAGDLASDMEFYEKVFPRNEGTDYKTERKQIKLHLLTRGACRECLQTFAKCWTAYVLHETHYMREYQRTHKERTNAYHNEWRKQRNNPYGLTVAQRKALKSIAQVERLADDVTKVTDVCGNEYIIQPH